MILDRHSGSPSVSDYVSKTIGTTHTQRREKSTDHELATGVLHKLQSLISIVGRGHATGHEGKVSRHARHEGQVASWHLSIVHSLHSWLTHILVGCW